MSLEYKGASALPTKGDPDKKKWEIVKDVTAFANAAGGTIIYGIAEGEGDDRHLPARIDPIDPTKNSKEQLDQLLQMAAPRIIGIKIHPIMINRDPKKAVYVVEVPQSDTAHQAPDDKYHRRYNCTTLAMKDYEIRDVMNRSKLPKVSLEAKLLPVSGYENVWVRITNVGPRIANALHCRVGIPQKIKNRRISLAATLNSTIKVFQDQRDGINYYLAKYWNSSHDPLFPKSEQVFHVNLSASERAPLEGIKTIRNIEFEVFADEMKPRKFSVPPNKLTSEWIHLDSSGFEVLE